MTWTLTLAKRAQKEFEKAPAKSQSLLRAALVQMQQNPFSGDIVRLKSERATWRRRVGSYRIFLTFTQARSTSTSWILPAEPARRTNSSPCPRPTTDYRSLKRRPARVVRIEGTIHKIVFRGPREPRLAFWACGRNSVRCY